MSKILLLVPTEFELNKLRPHLNHLDNENVEVAVCGFGPIAAAARTATLIQQVQPTAILLTGIAGAIGDSLSVGQASVFSDVLIDGIGAGSGEEFESAQSMGWNFWGTIGARLDLVGGSGAGSLLTVCAASGSQAQADSRCERFPGAIAEDMETFAVAFAAAVANVPLTAIRGISNVAGDRAKGNWKIDEALVAAAALVNKWTSAA
ncbi:futalosine hydrolase [Mariniblastus fucicola]|uniref:Futalosine hydrolase n=1 Tax=Mariniblastus fucicola TaxID=980251 RepID=A0A5B9P3L2_9BACT|nr:futalosine hydrolase [Mariniblastus fucicola]QEG20988.1 Futalosine hydrolase [Mariniblastus fucicola]